MATVHSAAGQGRATAHVGLRLDAVEQAVAALCGMKDGGYKQRTTVVGLGYATPERRWREWPVTVDSVSAVAEQIAATVAVSGLPYLQRLVSDQNRLVPELPQVHSAVDLARQSVVLVRIGRTAEALQGLQEHLRGLGERADAAAVLMRETGARVAEWAEQRSE